VPKNEAPPSIGNQLAQALHETGVSQKELARRLAGTKDPKKVEAKRRWLAKIAEGKIKRPGMAAVERALSLPPHYFQLPTPEQARLRADRLAELAATVDRLETTLDAMLTRLEALEARAQPGRRRANAGH
jgi:transcriptional regulator with XRE-family HTH domain